MLIDLNPLHLFSKKPNYVPFPSPKIATPEQPAKAVESTMSVKTILSDVVKGFEKVFKAGVEGAKDAEPVVEVLFPGLSGLFNSTVTEAATVEAAAAAAASQSGTGTQKAAAVVTAITSNVLAYAAANGYQVPSDADVNTIVSSVVAITNVFKPAVPAA